MGGGGRVEGRVEEGSEVWERIDRNESFLPRLGAAMGREVEGRGSVFCSDDSALESPSSRSRGRPRFLCGISTQESCFDCQPVSWGRVVVFC